MTDTTTLHLRQGDVLLVAVPAIPQAARPVPRVGGRIVLAYGEATGHAHTIRAREATLLAVGDERFLRVAAPVELGHEEHASIAVPPGTYRVVIQREYVPRSISGTPWRPVVD